MSSSTYRLTLIHRSLDDSIRKEMKRSRPDSFRLLRLKKMKLAIKDRLTARMRRGLAG
ncbi:YdcH family protein [Sphingosinicella sp. LHD-64]|uniref:YdcH family protein n=1 Tax=Sphingosinicella sp. LHD-64 TaxID=3072139 RepID=UPI00280DE2C8|nr:YdcH family protein [Sphingosinicella sp. LHD-64]MDQ8755054.1 YdcH family protein [Sphingosinicella sp. LHD-64]